MRDAPMDPIEFCPAAACAAAIVRLEDLTDQVNRLHAEVELAKAPDLLRQLEAIPEELMLAAADARDRLAKVQAVSAAGAMAQLLAAIRDIRVRDDVELSRARDLEARAARFLSSAGLSDAAICKRLSQTKLGKHLAPVVQLERAPCPT